MKTYIFAALLVLTGCAKLPWDASGTLDQIEKSGVLRAGIVTTDGAPTPADRRFLDLLARDTGSTPRIALGPADALLLQVEEGGLDIVVGRFAVDTPWSARVTIMPTPNQMGIKEGLAPGAAVRNGENEWVTLVYRHAPVLMEGRR